MNRRLSVLPAIIALICVPLVVRGQTAGATLKPAPYLNASSHPDSALEAILGSLEGTNLSLRDAVSSALENAASVLAAKAEYEAATGARRRESGYFDPSLFFTFNHLNQKSPATSIFTGTTTIQDNMTGGLRMNTPIGTSIEASMSTVKLETNSTFAFLNPQNTAVGTISLRQPLLGGFFVSATKNYSKAGYEMDAAKARYEQEVLAVTALVEQTYWDLYAAERDYAVQQLTHDRAEAFLNETITRAKTGLIGPNQVATARTFRAEQDILLIDREEQLSRVSDQLCSLMGRRPSTGLSRFLASDNPPETFSIDNINALVEQAQEKNLTLQAAKADVEARRALSSAAMWESLPKVDLVGSLGGNGLSGTPRNVIFGGDTLRTTVNGSLGDAMGEAVKRKFPQWSLGIEVSIPIMLRSGLGEKDRLDAEVVFAEQRQIQLARALEEQVRASCREVANGSRRLGAAREGVEAAQEQVRIGQIEFQNGRSTAFELVRLGADFAVAQQRYSQALVRSAKAAANLRQLTSGAYSGTTSR